jgi:hypothetical protein
MVDSSDLASLQRTQTEQLAYGPFLERLHAQGRERCTTCLATHAPGVGRRATIDVSECFG